MSALRRSRRSTTAAHVFYCKAPGGTASSVNHVRWRCVSRQWQPTAASLHANWLQQGGHQATGTEQPGWRSGL
uniref:Uncharacterized protein n=1 Tax=Tetradesmus obliquus TaxID=3088 RepID=A0A383VXB9_TETOB